MNWILGCLLMVSSALVCSSCTSFWSTEVAESKDNATTRKGAGLANAAGDGSVAAVPANQKLAVADVVVPAHSSDGEAVEQMTLSQARIADRMSEIEAELRQQREQLRLLEQGLLTGIAPEGLKIRESGVAGDGKESEKKVAQKPIDKVNSSKEDVALSKNPTESSPLKEPDLDPELFPASGTSDKLAVVKESSTTEFDSRIVRAKSKFQSSDFSGAVSDLAGISRQFGENAGEGAVRYWLGKSYLGLKEYGTARSEFEAYLTSYPSGSFAADARLSLAKSFSRLGLKERARSELRRVIKDFEGDEAAEMAAHELGAMQGNL